MQYTQAQINQYWADYVQSNEKAIKERLRFLLDNYNPENNDYLSPSDVYFCFEEARHAFMMGDFVASIIMCAVTIERQLAHLLGLPYYNPVDEKMSLEGDGKILIKTAKEKGIIDEELKDKLLELNTLRNDFVHGIDSSVHKRPQKQDPIKNALMWTENDVFQGEVEENAKKAIKILFETHEKLHYSKLSYF